MMFLYALTQRMTWIAVRAVTPLFLKCVISGREHLTYAPTPVLIVSNHKSYWDPFVLGALLPPFSVRLMPVGFMVNDRHSKYPFFKAFFAIAGVGAAQKGKGLSASLEHPRFFLERKKPFLIFPFGKIIREEISVSEERPGRGAAALIKAFPWLNIIPVHIDIAERKGFRALLPMREMSISIGAPYQTDHTKSVEAISNELVKSIFALKP